MVLGKWNELTINRFTSVGAYLVDEHDNDVLLPNKYLTDDMELAQLIRVFLYKDSEDRIVATTEIPYIERNQFAFLKVRDVNPFGAFLDWGLEKDLLVPFSEQPKNFEIDKRYLVYLYLDSATERLAATARVNPFFEEASLTEYTKNQTVSILILERTELGQKVIVDHKYKGLIFNSNISRSLRFGEQTVGYVQNIREDGKIDVLLSPEGYEKVDAFSRRLLQLIDENNGYLPLNDKSSSEDINAICGWSKKTFKKVVGNLYKERLITLSENGIHSLEGDNS